MRPLLASALLAGLLSGCLASPAAVPAPGEQAAAPGCPAPGVLFEVHESVEDGGRGEDAFEVPAGGCFVTVAFDRAEQVGRLEVRIAGAEHELFSYEGTALKSGPLTFLPGANAQSLDGGTIPAGTYTYHFAADGRARFSVRVAAE